MGEDLLNAFVTLFVIIDPIGLVPVFIALTSDLAPRDRRTVATKAIAIAAGLLLLFALGGHAVLGFLGISFSAFKIAGGLLLLATAFEMVFERRTERRDQQAASAEHHAARLSEIAVFPLAIPLLAGPGAITSIILLMGRAEGEPAEQAGVLGVAAAVLAISYVLFLISGPVARLLGKTGVVVTSRVLGVLLAALAVQYVIDGVTTVLAG
ncbi:MarC family protein [Futiania mangrovi]|uniref:UPF0056 membrane protein n=1 Tax=Futiania mangrovi TaxID=2959716 RepID=A0A9J6PF62_9PROT|nr:MarC family protein [Futiania mangrovii]MCP1337353.1 MarC family protein [Futiania mangrovii]